MGMPRGYTDAKDGKRTYSPPPGPPISVAKDEPAPAPGERPAQLPNAALHGLLGEFANLGAIRGGSSTGLLLGALACSGSCFGRTAFVAHGLTRQFPRLIVRLVSPPLAAQRGHIISALAVIFARVNEHLAPDQRIDMVTGPMTSARAFRPKQNEATPRPTLIVDHLDDGWWRRRDARAPILGSWDGLNLASWSDPARVVLPPLTLVGQSLTTDLGEFSAGGREVAHRSLWSLLDGSFGPPGPQSLDVAALEKLAQQLASVFSRTGPVGEMFHSMSAAAPCR